MESRRNEVPNEAPLRWTLHITEAAPLHEKAHFVYCWGVKVKAIGDDTVSPTVKRLAPRQENLITVFFWAPRLARLTVRIPISPSPSITPKYTAVLLSGEAELSFGVIFPTGHTECPQRTRIPSLPPSRSALVSVWIVDARAPNLVNTTSSGQQWWY